MPVPSMHPSSWEGSQALLNRGDMSGMRQSQGTRSQDDANVGYLYQRSHSDVPMGGGFPQKRWALGDDSMLEQSRQMTSVQELERQFQGLAMSQAPGARSEMSHQSKKLWGDDHQKSEDGQPKSFLPWGSREDAWTSGPTDSSSQIGMNMVEYVLGVSPNKMESSGSLSRMKSFIPQQEGEEKKSKTPSPFEDRTGEDPKEGGMQANGMMANGLDDGGFRNSRQTSPADEERQGPVGMPIEPKLHMRDGSDFMDGGQGFGLDSHHQQQQQQQFDQVNLQYGTDFGSQMVPSMDSPNSFNMDYNQQLLQRQQQPIAMLTPQQPFTLPGQQPLGVAGPNPMSQGPYVLAQDPYVAAGVPFAGQHKKSSLFLRPSYPTLSPFEDNPNFALT
ncbi:hypothetical protein RRG08_034060 [Elysia crispata]|uniref:Pumilio n=1 Tax=Elysia crispata TaxID=231223 RepID=A0AAE0YKH5_9GAST|nr:hypothetical protein RRG08_034060 [Elysia crispata]